MSSVRRRGRTVVDLATSSGVITAPSSRTAIDTATALLHVVELDLLESAVTVVSLSRFLSENPDAMGVFSTAKGD